MKSFKDDLATGKITLWKYIMNSVHSICSMFSLFYEAVFFIRLI